jgi:hypothetical protein
MLGHCYLEFDACYLEFIWNLVLVICDFKNLKMVPKQLSTSTYSKDVVFGF